VYFYRNLRNFVHNTISIHSACKAVKQATEQSLLQFRRKTAFFHLLCWSNIQTKGQNIKTTGPKPAAAPPSLAITALAI